ncbi:MAG: tyrosine-type recombinase/integrase [Methanotrichaceae archaeon]
MKVSAITQTSTSPIMFIERFADDCELRGMSPRTIERYISSIRAFEKYITSEGYDFGLAADREVLRGFLDHIRREKGLCQKTIENSFTAISSFYEFFVYEKIVDANPVLAVRKRYLRSYKDNDDGHVRKLISIEEMARLINSAVDIRDKAIITLLAKTGIRRNELISLDITDADLTEQAIRLKHTAKRTNRTVFFDNEAAFILRRWIKIREGRNIKNSKALFLNADGDRLERHGIYDVVVKAALEAGLHDPNSERLEDHFSPHCCRHWFTTHLRRAGMRREFIQELRGDSRREAIYIYDHIDLKELRESYLAHIPQLGI